MTSLETTPELKIGLSAHTRVIVSGLTAVGLVISGFLLFGLDFIANTSAMIIALYVTVSVVVGITEKSKQLLSVVLVSASFLLISELAFSYLHQFAALCASLFVLLALTKYSLMKDHDSGWLGALCADVLSLIFLLVIELILIVGRLFLV